MRFVSLFLVLGVAACSPTMTGDITGLHPDASAIDACIGCDLGPRDAHVDAADTGSDADLDAGMDATVDASDLGPPDSGTCGDGGICCNRVSDCPIVGGTLQVCIHHVCETPTSCSSSTMCAGLVCSTAQSVCADCNMDSDCASIPGTRCGADVCTPAPTCSSDTQCSAMGLVCDMPRSRCVECNADADCGSTSGRFCSADHVCLTTCHTAADCDDHAFCNGPETCGPTSLGHNPRGCVDGTSPCSGTTPTCTEASHSCGA